MGPYCEFCGQRCFVERRVPGSPVSILATCQRGAAHDRAVLGVDFRTAHNPHGPCDHCVDAVQPVETFHLGLARWNVTDAKRLLDEHRAERTEQVPVAQLVGLLTFIGVDPEAAAKLPDEALDVPLIAITDDNTGRAQLIDGFHRIHAAHERGRDHLMVAVLGAEDSAAVRMEDRR